MYKYTYLAHVFSFSFLGIEILLHNLNNPFHPVRHTGTPFRRRVTHTMTLPCSVSPSLYPLTSPSTKVLVSDAGDIEDLLADIEPTVDPVSRRLRNGGGRVLGGGGGGVLGFF